MVWYSKRQNGILKDPTNHHFWYPPLFLGLRTKPFSPSDLPGRHWPAGGRLTALRWPRLPSHKYTFGAQETTEYHEGPVGFWNRPFSWALERVEFFVPFSFWCPFFFCCPFFVGAPFFCALFFWVGGWCRLELCYFCKLWQEKCRIADEFSVLQPNTRFRA